MKALFISIQRVGKLLRKEKTEYIFEPNSIESMTYTNDNNKYHWIKIMYAIDDIFKLINGIFR